MNRWTVTILKEAKKRVDAVYGDKGLTLDSLYKILKKIKAGESTMDQRRFSATKTMRSAALIAAVAADFEADRRIGIKSLAFAHMKQFSTFFTRIWAL
jgi:hypothetical protein